MSLSKKILLLLVLFLAFISLGSSLDCWATFEVNSHIDLLQKCPSCSYVNITSITYPNGTVFINEAMQKIGPNYNYTLPDSSMNGKISYGVIGDKNSIDPPEEETFCIEITPTGKKIEKPESNFYFIILFLFLILSGVFLTISIMSPYENRKELTEDGWAITRVTKGKYVKLISFWIFYGFFLLFVTIISGIANNYIAFEGLRVMITRLWFFLNVVGKGLNWIMGITLIIMTWKDILLNKIILKEGRKLLNQDG